MDWQAIGVGLTAGIALVGFNGWVMKIIIDSAIKTALLGIERDFVTKADFDKHIERCPYANGANH